MKARAARSLGLSNVGIVAAVGVFLAVLAGLYQRAEAVRPETHLVYTQVLRDLRETDIRIDGELLANRLELSRNYDALTHHAIEALRIGARLEEVPDFLAADDRARLHAAATALQTLLADKADRIDRFKRIDSVLRNSLAFLPVIAADYLDAAGEAPQRAAVDRYVRAVLAFARAPDAAGLDSVTAAAARLSGFALPPAWRARLDNLTLHGTLIVRRLEELDRLTEEIFALDTGAALATLQRMYVQGHGNAAVAANRYRTLLYVLAVLLAVYLAWTVSRLERAHREVSERHAAQMAAEKQIRLHATAFRNAHDGLALTDATGNILDVNPAFSRITGWERSEVIGRNPRILKSGRHDHEFYAAMWRSLAETGSWRGEIWNRHKCGEICPELLSISAVRDEASGELTNYVAVFTDISRIKAQERQLSRMAYYDALTELPNRTLLADRLVHGIAQCRRAGGLLAVCYLDLDGFKPINDTWGHDAGDRVLVEVSRRLKEGLRGGDTVARLGGDEFVLLLGLADLEECEVVLQRILGEIARPLSVLPEPRSLSASIGVALFPHDDSDPDTLLRHADQAMYQVKQEGKSGYRVFDAERDRSLRSRQDQVMRIRQALEDHELELYYQPKVDMRAGKVLGAEALLRWRHPEKGLLPPTDFLPLIEDGELIKAVGDWVIESALTQMDRWHAEGLDIDVSVNVAARQLQAQGFVEKLKAALFLHPESASRLELEVLETAALEDIAQTSHIIDECRAIGVRFSLDDFGTGYSSLAYLKRLPVETIKIDQSFVREMLNDRDSLAIVHGVLSLADAFQRQAVAEGVETPEHGRLLLQLDCDVAQGYGIARPMPADDIAGWVRQWRPDPAWSRVRDRYWRDDDYPLFSAEVEHRNWVAQLAYAVNEGQPLSQLHLADERHCRFGRWYYGGGRNRYGKLSAYLRIEAPHRRAHELALRIDRYRRDGREEDARATLTELFAARDEVLAALAELQDATGRPR